MEQVNADLDERTREMLVVNLRHTAARITAWANKFEAGGAQSKRLHGLLPKRAAALAMKLRTEGNALIREAAEALDTFGKEPND